MKTPTVRLPKSLAAAIEAKSRLRAIADLIGSVGGLPADLSARKKGYLWASRYGRRRAR